MADRTNSRALPDDLRDAHLDSLWRAASTDEPSPAIDDAILALARRDADTRPRDTKTAQSMRPARWWWPLAAAAAIGVIVVGLLPLMPSELAERSDNIQPGLRNDPANVAERDAAGTSTRASTATEPPQQAASTAAVPTAPNAPAPAPPITRSEKRIAHEDAKRLASREGASIAPRVVGAPTPPPSATLAPPAPQPFPDTAMRAAPVAKARAFDQNNRAIQSESTGPIAEWIARLRRLRSENRRDEANKEWAAFREQHRNAEQLLPPDLREWLIGNPGAHDTEATGVTRSRE